MQQLAELLAACFATVNMPYTLLLIVVFLYWISVIAGALDVSVLDVDVDLDGDMDMDLDMDVDADVDGGELAAGGESGFQSILRYFNVGEVPVTILLSFFIISAWAIGIVSNWYLHRNHSMVMGLIVLVPNVLISLHVAKLCSLPFRALFKALDKGVGQHEEDLIGRRCVVTTSLATDAFGQVEVKTGGAPLLLSVNTDGDELAKGASAVIIDFDKAKGLYVISKLEMEV